VKEGETAIVLFRDLITQPGETIQFHRDKIDEYGYCWWGWWKKHIEDIPRHLLSHLAQISDEAVTGPRPTVFAFDCGTHRIYENDLQGIEIAANDEAMRSPEIEKTPEYYAHVKSAVWLKVSAIRDVVNAPETLHSMTYVEFPTWRNSKYEEYRGKRIAGTTELDEMLVTFWHVYFHGKAQMELPIVPTQE